MKTKVLIKTPKGYALSTQKKLMPFILGLKRKSTHEIHTTKDDDEIIWIIESDIKTHFRITRNIILFDKLVSTLLNNKSIRKLAKLTKSQEHELDRMLFKQTKVELII